MMVFLYLINYLPRRSVWQNIKWPPSVIRVYHSISKITTNLRDRFDPFFKQNHFIRNRKLPVNLTVALIIELIKNKNLLGYQLSINNFTASLALINSKFKYFSLSKSAFSKARKKLSYKVIELINREFVKENQVKNTYKGLRLFAIDGTKLTMPDSPELEFIFKKPKNKISNAYMPQATMVACLDLTSNLTSEIEIGSCDTSEKELALKFLPNIEKKSLVITDRYFGNRIFFYNCEKEKLFYLSRIKSGNRAMIEVKKFINSKMKSAVVNINIIEKDCTLKVRLIRGSKDKDGNIIVYATNLLNKNLFHSKELIMLYKERWVIETYFNRLKNILNIRKFHSRSYNEVMQEIYGSILYANITSSFMNLTFKVYNVLKFNKLSWKSAFNSVSRYILDFIFAKCRGKYLVFIKIFEVLNDIHKTKSIDRVDRFYPRYSKQPQHFWTKSETRTTAKAAFGLK